MNEDGPLWLGDTLDRMAARGFKRINDPRHKKDAMSKETVGRANIDDFLCAIQHEIAMLRRALKVSGEKSLALQPVVSALDVYAAAIEEKVETYAADLREEGYR